jgi:thioredoxin-related protein
MKKLALLLLACCALTEVRAAEPQWTTDVPRAVAQAKTDNKMVLLDFTGSDWCVWCMKFKKEALDTADFNNYAAKNLVLVEVDFPRQKPEPDGLKKANKALAGQYKVDGFPTFVVLNKDGKEIGRQEGYEPGGAKAFIAKIDGFKPKN